MTSLRTIAKRHASLISDNLRIQAEQRAAEQKRIADEAIALARPYLDVLCEQITNDEIDRQLNSDTTILKSQTVEVSLPAEADALFTNVMVPYTFGEYHSMNMFLELARLAASPLFERLKELEQAGFEFQVTGPPMDNFLRIWPPG